VSHHELPPRVVIPQAQQEKDKDKKGALMFQHKSLGLLTGIFVAPRLIVKLMTKAPAPFPGIHAIQVRA
jgi:cytochrome b561